MNLALVPLSLRPNISHQHSLASFLSSRSTYLKFANTSYRFTTNPHCVPHRTLPTHNQKKSANKTQKNKKFRTPCVSNCGSFRTETQFGTQGIVNSKSLVPKHQLPTGASCPTMIGISAHCSPAPASWASYPEANGGMAD
ncbi:hypothetical protein HBH98_088270 [Parastagonospora nodorum]|nr:hypothetical protein HBI10_115050 [Parastagonospora nodorum]KAH4013203.1 hypothetical protein HBI13_181100 [Parastagonospora nodorum]KAH4035271.1 hypothetical protein HBI09_097500 [Parastagonospora nodorum]KAH4347985.1 hypothetical protein HBH98_088270 [Parastagonospora nodorum]KAH4407625.1 hypothetical protein HBH99_081490 [Parastagonospora nodorum]